LKNLSIVIPHYNSVTTLTKLLNSIPRKENIEILVIDDKSTNDKEEYDKILKCKEFNNVTFLKNNTRNNGAGTCRNIGLKNLMGDWVLFADSDDYFTKSFFEIVEEYFHSDNDVVFFTPTSIESDTGKESERHLPYKNLIDEYNNLPDITTETNLRYKFFVPWSKLISTEFLRENNIYFDEELASNDVIFSTKVGHFMERFETSTQVIYCVTRSVGTLTTNKSEDVFDARLRVHIDYCKYLKQNLSREQYTVIQPTGAGFLYKILINMMGIKKFFAVFLILMKNKVPLINPKFFNPVFLLKKTLYYKKINQRKEKYYKG